VRPGRGKNKKSRRSPVAPPDLLTPESASRLREQGLLSRVVRLPYLPPETTAMPAVTKMPTTVPAAAPAPAAPPLAAPIPTPAPAAISTPARQPATSPPSPAPRSAAPAPAPAAATGTSSTTAARHPVDDLDTTLLRPRHLDLELPDGSRVQIGGRPIVIGRRPTGSTRTSSAGSTMQSQTHPAPAMNPTTGHPTQPETDHASQPATGDELIAIDDPTRSISRRHLRVMARPDGSVWAEDLDSGNGTLVERGGESVSALIPAVPVKIVSRDVLVLGEHRVRVVRRPPGPLPQTSTRGSADSAVIRPS